MRLGNALAKHCNGGQKFRYDRANSANGEFIFGESAEMVRGVFGIVVFFYSYRTDH